jgi:hypothetical protein
MQTKQNECLDLLISLIKNPMDIFVIERQMSAKHRFTIGQIAKRILILNLKEWVNKYSVDELAKMVNYNPKVLEKIIKQLS